MERNVPRPLAMVGLEKCETVSDGIALLFGGSSEEVMLREMIESLAKIISAGGSVFIVYDVRGDDAFHALLKGMCDDGWFLRKIRKQSAEKDFSKIFLEVNTAERFVYSQLVTQDSVALVVGPFREGFGDKLSRKVNTIFCVNEEIQLDPAVLPCLRQVLLNPKLAMPLIYYAILERSFLGKCYIADLIKDLEILEVTSRDLISV